MLLIQEDAGHYPVYAWFTLAFTLCLLLGILAVTVTDTAELFQVALMGYLAVALILTSCSVNTLIYTSNSVQQLAAAGFMLLAVADVQVPTTY